MLACKSKGSGSSFASCPPGHVVVLARKGDELLENVRRLKQSESGGDGLSS